MNISNQVIHNQTTDNGDYAMQLPTIQENKDLQQAVDAKELYIKLGLNPAHWSRWHGMNIEQNPFAVSGLDFVAFTMMVNGREFPNYMLSIDFAKKLAMQVRTEMGERIRDYFLECERKASQPVVALPDFTNPAIAARAWADEYQEKQIAQEQLAIAAPKVSAYDKLIESTHLKSVGDVAKSIGLRSAQALNKKLEAVRAYDGRCGNRVWSGWFVEQGLGEMRTTDEGYSSNKMTAKGQAWALNLFGGNE